MDTSISIQTHNLGKQYSRKGSYALRNLSIKVHKGEVYGFLGPNGAGKSTTIRLLLNFIQPSKGSAEIFGHDIVKESVKVRSSIGYLSGDFKAYEKMTGKQFLDYMAEIQPLKKKNAITELSKTFQISLNKRIRDLSKGNRQKLGIIQALMHDPELLILDEPTDGLDPLMQEAFYEVIRNRKASGVTVFVSSHNLSEVKKMCDRVGIIRDGKLVSEEAISDLAMEASQTFEVVFASSIPKKQIFAVPGVKKVYTSGNKINIHVHGDIRPFLKFLSNQQIQQLATKELNLEEEFMRFYENGVNK